MEQQPSLRQIGIRYGLIVALVMVVYSLILQFAGLAMNRPLGFLTYAILIAGMVVAHNTFKRDGDGYMTLGQGISIGMWLTLVAGVISSVFSYLYLKFIDDSVIQTAMDEAITQMEERGMPDDQIDQAMKITEKFMQPGAMMLIALVTMLILGFIISLVVSAITRKTNPQITT
jgi:hypothetical protein